MAGQVGGASFSSCGPQTHPHKAPISARSRSSAQRLHQAPGKGPSRRSNATGANTSSQSPQAEPPPPAPSTAPPPSEDAAAAAAAAAQEAAAAATAQKQQRQNLILGACLEAGAGFAGTLVSTAAGWNLSAASSGNQSWPACSVGLVKGPIGIGDGAAAAGAGPGGGGQGAGSMHVVVRANISGKVQALPPGVAVAFQDVCSLSLPPVLFRPANVSAAPAAAPGTRPSPLNTTHSLYPYAAALTCGGCLVPLPTAAAVCLHAATNALGEDAAGASLVSLAFAFTEPSAMSATRQAVGYLGHGLTGTPASL